MEQRYPVFKYSSQPSHSILAGQAGVGKGGGRQIHLCRAGRHKYEVQHGEKRRKQREPGGGRETPVAAEGGAGEGAGRV